MDFVNFFKLGCNYAKVGLTFALVAVIILLIVFYVFRKKYKNELKNKIKKRRIFWGTLFLGYVITLLGIVLFSKLCIYSSVSNLKIFSTYKLALEMKDVETNIYLNSIIGNIMLFVPMGILLPLTFKSFRNELKFFVYALVSPLLLEIIEVTSGNAFFDIDDIFNNFIGAEIGFAIVTIILSIYYLNSNTSGVTKEINEERYNKKSDELKKDKVIYSIKKVIFECIKLIVILGTLKILLR